MQCTFCWRLEIRDCIKKRKVNETASKNRHDRYMKRRLLSKKQPAMKQTYVSIDEHQMDLAIDGLAEESTVGYETEKKFVDEACQVEIMFCEEDYPETNMLMCNRYIFNSSFNDAEIQTEITKSKTVMSVIPVNKSRKNKKCGTVAKTFADKAVGLDFQFGDMNCSNGFIGFDSIKTDEQLSDLAGTSFNTFRFLFNRIKFSDKWIKVSKENRLLIFLMKIKLNLSFCALSVIFGIHRTTVSKIFFSTLQNLYFATANLVFWPDKDTVQGLMPECFHPQYTQTRVILDCTEFRIETPASVENRVHCYSHYKKGFTAKLLVGITPSGFISFKSKVAGGRKSDSQLTIESGLIDLLEDGDVVLADKGFPEIRKTIDESGKGVILVMPPFLGKNKEFTEDETESTYNISRVRIHVERIMQRLRTYQFLNKIPAYLFHHIDDIVHVCCVLVNLQPPIIADKKEGEEKKS